MVRHQRLGLEVDLFIETPFIIHKDGRVLLPGHYMNVTTVLTPALHLRRSSTQPGRESRQDSLQLLALKRDVILKPDSIFVSTPRLGQM